MCQGSVFPKQRVCSALCGSVYEGGTLFAVKGLSWCLYNEVEPNMASALMAPPAGRLFIGWANDRLDSAG